MTGVMDSGLAPVARPGMTLTRSDSPAPHSVPICRLHYAHDPEKWTPVFRQDHGPLNKRMIRKRPAPGLMRGGRRFSDKIMRYSIGCRGAGLRSRRSEPVAHRRVGRVARVIVAAFLSAAFHSIALAQASEAPPSEAPPSQAPQPQPEMRENCPGLVASDRPRAIPAAFRLAALNPDQVRITLSATRPS